MTLTAGQTDRAFGVLIGSAAGDALAVGYECAPRVLTDAPRTITTPQDGARTVLLHCAASHSRTLRCLADAQRAIDSDPREMVSP